MRKLDVLVATKDGKRPGGLEHIGEHTYKSSTALPWSKAANWLLDQVKPTLYGGELQGGDALFIDDDVTILPSTFDLLDRYWDSADVFGFALGHPINKDRILSVGFEYLWETDGKQLSRNLRPVKNQAILTPSYVPHVTASLMVIKRSALELVRFPEWPGAHYEDIAFTLDCWLKGLKVAYLPGLALHDTVDLEGGGQAGATKGRDPKFRDEQAVNLRCLNEWILRHEVHKAIEDGRIPADPIPIVLGG